MPINWKALPILLLAECCSSHQPAPAASHTESPADVLVDLIELPEPNIAELREQGTVPGGNAPYIVRLSQSEGGVLVRITFGDRVIGDVRLPSSQFPSLDIRSADFRAETSSDSTAFILSLKYGDERMCFVNDDGRDRIRLNFSDQDAPFYNVLTFQNCEPVHREMCLENCEPAESSHEM